MSIHTYKTRGNRSKAVASHRSSAANGSESTFGFADNRSEAIAQRKLQEAAKDSPQVQQSKAIQGIADNSLKGGKKSQFIQKKEHETGTVDPLRNVTQRFGSIRFANLDESIQEYGIKGRDLINTLRNAPIIRRFLRNKNVLITLELYGATPASVGVVGPQVQVQLAPWFFKHQSLGRIVGMLAHEFGVHPLSDELLTEDEKESEREAIRNQTELQTGREQDTITPGEVQQADHAFAVVENQPRYRVYRETVYDLVSQMLRETQSNQESTISERQVSDTIMTYLSDIAIILGTKDDWGNLFWIRRQRMVAQYYNLERDKWLGFLEGKANEDDLKRLTPGTKTSWDVVGEVLGLLGSLIKSGFTTGATITKSEQVETGGLLPDITTNQQEVLTDHGFNLQPLTVTQADSYIYATLDAARGVSATMTQNQILLRYLDYLDDVNNETANPDLYRDIQEVVDDIIAEDFSGQQTDERVDYIAQGLNAKISVIQPNGKMILKNPGGQTGPYYLLFVEKPTPHYRWCQ